MRAASFLQPSPMSQLRSIFAHAPTLPEATPGAKKLNSLSHSSARLLGLRVFDEVERDLVVRTQLRDQRQIAGNNMRDTR